MREVEPMRMEWEDCPSMYFRRPTNVSVSFCCAGQGCSCCIAIKAALAQRKAARLLQAAMLFFVGIAAVAEEMTDENEVVR